MKHELKTLADLAKLENGSLVSVKGMARGLDQLGAYHIFFLESEGGFVSSEETPVVLAMMLNEKYDNDYLVKPILKASSEGNLGIIVDAKVSNRGGSLSLEVETLYLGNYSVTAKSRGMR
ncbi:hypothetical protein HZA97_06775 [Candidatus Woesearchaeota archaeon]|nr:hypothetical protein [Candidatus Woesearchaeota archaeon]